MDLLRRQVGRVGRDDEGHVEDDRVAQPRQHRVGDSRHQDPHQDAAQERDQRHPGDVPGGVVPAERYADGDGVDHQGGAVVGQALRFEQHELALRQALRQGRRRGSVGRGDGCAEDQRRRPRDAQRRGDPGDGEGGGHHEYRRGDQDAAQVAADGVLRRRETLPEQQRREEEHQHHLVRHPQVFQTGDEGHEETQQHLGQRHGEPENGGQGIASHHRGTDADHDDETFHGVPFRGSRCREKSQPQ